MGWELIASIRNQEMHSFHWVGYADQIEHSIVVSDYVGWNMVASYVDYLNIILAARGILQIENRAKNIEYSSNLEVLLRFKLIH